MTSSLKLTGVFFLTVAFDIGFVHSAIPGYIDIPSTRASYKYHNERENWSDAKYWCNSDGALLFHPEDKNELSTVIRELGVEDQFIVSGYKQSMSGWSDLTYKTVDGRLITEVYNKWTTDKNISAQLCPSTCNCGYISVSTLELVDGECDVRKPYICKTALKTTKEYVDAILPGYNYIASTSAWYKYHNEAATLTVARDTCLKEGGVVFHPDNENELKTVLKMQKHLNSSIFAGVTTTSDVYTTVTGRPLSEVYNKWGQGEPDNGLQQQWECAVISVSSHELITANCLEPLTYFCKATDSTMPMFVGNLTRQLTEKIADLETQLAKPKTAPEPKTSPKPKM